MAKQVKASIELENGKKLTHYQRLVIKQELFNHHSFEIAVPFEILEKEDGAFFNQAHKNVCGQPVSFSFDPVLKNEKFDFNFKGIISEIALNNQSDMSNQFIIKGYSPGILLEDSAMKRTFLNKSLQQIFDAVLSPYPGNIIKKQLKPRHKNPNKYIVQYDETNFQFLNRLAAEYGEWFYYNGRELTLGEPQGGKAVDFVIDGIQTFDMSIVLSPAKFKMSGYDYTKNKTYEGKSGSQSVEGINQFGQFALDESENLFSQEAQLTANKPVYSQGELDEFVKFRRSGIVSNMVIFNGKGENPDITIGSVVNVIGVRPVQGGKTKNENFGKYRVIEITHEVDSAGNYFNSFRAMPETPKYPPVNLYYHHPVGQTELATVIDNNDPDKLSRVKVEFNWPGGDKQSDWVRTGSFYAGGGDGKGMQFIPEKDAQVVIGYELNKPEYPFVITSLYPKIDGMRSAKGQNEEKAIYTKAGNTVEFMDKQGENKIKITNANKPDTVVTVDFQGDGKISIATNGDVEITTGKNISMTAGKNISITAGENLSVSVGKDYSLTAANKLTMDATEFSVAAQTKADISASANMKITGTNTEINGDAVLTVKGGMVKIN